MTTIELNNGPRSAGVSYQQLLDADNFEVPEVLRSQSPIDLGTQDLPIARYTTREFHEIEKAKVWSRVWQMACRGEDLPNVGDSVVYDIADTSIVVVRQPDLSLKAYYNACLHRGRKLCDFDGNKTELRCPFHGFTWDLGGTLVRMPGEWDFPHVRKEEFCLPELRVGEWGGFVFVNMDPACEPLDSFLGAELTRQFERWPLELRYKQAHVAKIMPCNWKVTQEAFMEAFHVVATHPQLLASIGDDNSQYDAWGNFSRAITPNGTPSPHLHWEPSQQQMLDSMLDRRLDEDAKLIVPEGQSARAVFAALSRNMLQASVGAGAAQLSDAECADSIYYTVFPNFHHWGAYNRITYRFRPYGDDHTRSIMECMFLAPFTGERPASAPIHWLDEDEPWTNAPELGMLARVFDQDSLNLRQVQAGLNTLAKSKPGCTLSQYQELKVRHFHHILERWIAD
jgi:phenylpropionate dioxygenase-like ring-hydroxylating dioxygenase large terminal subunit